MTSGRGKAGGRAASVAALACLCAAAFLASSCAGSPRPGGASTSRQPSGAVPPPGTVAPPASPAAAALRPAASPWQASALASLSNRELPGGARLSLRRTPGRPLAAAELCLVGTGLQEKAGDEGALALGLALLSRGKAGEEPGALLSRIRSAGGRLELKELSYDAIALELVAPPADLPALLASLVEALCQPAFASPGFPSAEFDAVMKDFRIRKLKEEGDPFLRATDRIRTETYRDHPYSVPPLGTEASLLSLTREEVAARWKAQVGSERIVMAVVGDLDLATLTDLLSPALAALGRRGPDLDKPPQLPIKPGLLLEAVSGAQGAWLRADFSAPPESSPDYPALAVALAMLDDVLMEELRGKQPLAYGAWTRLSLAAAPSGSIIVNRATSAEAAKEAVERAIAVLSGGSCLALDGSGYAPVQAALESYKARTLARLYERTAGASDMAERMARDLAAGGDGSAWFRLADRLAAVQAKDLLRVFRERLVLGPMIWAVAAPESLLSPLKATH